jgi:hypothetical protein
MVQYDVKMMFGTTLHHHNILSIGPNKIDILVGVACFSKTELVGRHFFLFYLEMLPLN